MEHRLPLRPALWLHVLPYLPRVYVQRYDLSPNYRYVYRDNYIYQVDPRTYAITRIIDAITR